MNENDAMAHLDEVPAWTEQEAANVVRLRPSAADMKAEARGVPIITLGAGELHNIATQAESALIQADVPFFVRGEAGLVRPVVDEVPAANGQRAKVARLSPVTEPVMLDHLSRSAAWQKWDGRSKGFITADPPAKVAATVLARDGEWRLRRLSGVITTPTLRPDGTILDRPGYDAATQLLLLDPPKMPRIPDKPTKADAVNALAVLDELLDEFPFVDDASRAVALSALLTPVVRGALPVVPLHATTAPVPGSGKSFIIDLASAINSGERAPVLTAGRTEEETEKRLVAAMLSGQTIISIDNVNGQLGGDFLCQMIERPTVGVRPLGQSTYVKVESRSCCFATGNNIQLLGDMTRRVLLCSLDPDMERPELRTFRGNPFHTVLADRGKYVAAALTAIRAYVVAGKPDQASPLASFEEWSGLVRSALIWLGREDPCVTMLKARADDPITSMLTNLFSAWHEAVAGSARDTAAIKQEAAVCDAFGALLHPQLREALVEAAGDNRDTINTRKLGHFLGRYEGRIVEGLKLVSEKDGHTKQKLWRVIKA